MQKKPQPNKPEPCPCCGAKAIIVTGYDERCGCDDYWIECPNFFRCSVRPFTRSWLYQSDAIEAWNKKEFVKVNRDPIGRC